MNKKRYLLVLVVITLTVTMAAVLAYQERAECQECRIVRIHGGATGQVVGIYIEPKTMWIEKGTCVVWINWARNDEVKVEFAEGKKCEDLTDAPMGFRLDAANCYVTSWIPLGGTSSLRFAEEGTFEYVIEAKKGVRENGKIIVR